MNESPKNNRDSSSARASEMPETKQLFEQLYAQLRAIAASQLQRLPAGQTLHPTEIVHEVFEKMQGARIWESQRHFLNTAAQAMRQLLVDRARRRLAQKRGGKVTTSEWLDDRIVVHHEDDRLLEVHEALEELGETDARAAKLIELTFFLGMNQNEAAVVVGISERTARRDLVFAQAWLTKTLNRD